MGENEVAMESLTLLDTLLSQPGSLSPVFQPIFEVHSQGYTLHSLECLTRGPKGSSLERADILFAYVRRKRAEIVVDRACIKMMFRAVASLPHDPCFSVNVHASTLARDPDFAGYLKELADDFAIRPCRVMIELVEHTPFWDRAGVWRTLRELRELGARIAVDDIGAGESNFNMILDCCPDAFKLDTYLVRHCHADQRRLAVLESIATLAYKFGAKVIAEGVDQYSDLEALLRLGINLVQGFLLAAPMSAEDLLESGLLAGRFVPQLILVPDAELGFHEEIARLGA